MELYRLPKVISKKVGDALLGVAANRQVCPAFSEITFGNHSKHTRPFEEGERDRPGRTSRRPADWTVADRTNERCA